MGIITHYLFFVSMEIAINLFDMKMNSEKIAFLKGFGKRIQILREEKQLSLRQLAQNCEIDYSDISKIEKGLRNIQMSTVVELAKGLDVHPQQLFDFKLNCEK
ncbi:Helix-turn-helix domain-containing protein [Epilithonimonas bovis DSM 19482]|uniref:Helix-turn-helix domain-containing protein n=1 Tax=Epilithonimonas bovis DSM 19482 TaxID=1121284 RepID=A0A1U7PYD6_9FLAO|nr:helix-turn-helix transcriptional regulator [Epilithonimonas bovis]SIT97909.1 Helix-turn-helix domain-containing protein [Epilithonimonas bovis DSM 19482]